MLCCIAGYAKNPVWSRLKRIRQRRRALAATSTCIVYQLFRTTEWFESDRGTGMPSKYDNSKRTHPSNYYRTFYLEINFVIGGTYHRLPILVVNKWDVRNIIYIFETLAVSRPRLRNGAEVICVWNFLLCVRWANPSLCKSNVHFDGILLIQPASCFFRCTLSLYWKCIHLHMNVGRGGEGVGGEEEGRGGKEGRVGRRGGWGREGRVGEGGEGGGGRGGEGRGREGREGKDNEFVVSLV